MGPGRSAELTAAGVPGAVVEDVLKTDRYATTLRIRLPDGTRAVHKTSVVRLPPGVRVTSAARRLARREADQLERLAGIRGVPRLLGRPAPDALLREWIEGTTLRALDRVPDTVFPALRELLAAVHARGVAYADLAKEDNVVVDETGRPWLVDFQICVAKGSSLGWLAERLMRADRYHLARHVKRRRPDQLTDDDRAALADGQSLLSRLHRSVVKKPYNLVTRRLVRRWSGAGEGRRRDEPRGLRER
jgi:RIO-like serine/threonine protein kinase